MQTSSIWILLASVFVIIIVILYGMYVMSISSKKIFLGSGKPISMAKMVLSSIQITSQILFGILIIGILSVMLIEGKITSDAGLPVISGIVGYLLGKSFKDVYEAPNGSNRPRGQNILQNENAPGE